MAVTLGDVVLYLRAEDKDLDRNLAQAEQKARGWADRVGGFLIHALSFAVGGYILNGLEKITGGIGGIYDGMIGGNQAFEQYNNQFAVLLGSTELAEKRLKDLAEFGRKTPFDLPQVVEADRVLQGFGLHAADVAKRFGYSGEQIRTIAGDVAAGTGANFQEMAGLIGKFSAGATGEAIEQFQRLGVATRTELAGMGVEFSKAGEMMSPMPTAMNALLKLMEQKYGGLMDIQSSTFGGMLSNLRDWAGETLRELGKPLFEVAKEKLRDLMDFLGSPAAQGAIDQFAGLLRNATGVIMDFIGSLTGGISLQAWAEGLANALATANRFLAQLRDELLGLTSGDIMGQLATGIEAVQTRLSDSLGRLSKTHERTLAQIKGQMAAAGDDMGQAMEGIAKKYEPRITAIEEQYAKTRDGIMRQIASTQESYDQQMADSRGRLADRLTEMDRSMAEKRRSAAERVTSTIASYEQRILDVRQRAAQQLEDLDASHQERRLDLAAAVDEAVTDEQWAQAMRRLGAENQAYERQKGNLTDRAAEEEARLKGEQDKAVAGVREQLSREEAEYQYQVEREKARAAESEARTTEQYDKAVAELQRRLAEEDAARQTQLAKIAVERGEEETKVRAAYATQMAMLQQRLAAEEQAYAEQRAEIAAMAAAEDARLIQETMQRIMVLGTGPAAEIAAFLRNGFKQGFSREWFEAEVLPILSANLDLITREIKKWVEKPETQEQFQSIGRSLGGLLLEGLTALFGDAKQQEIVALKLGQMLLNVSNTLGPKLLEIGGEIGKGLLKGIAGEKGGDYIVVGKASGFQFGGVVPGPAGMPQLAVVHGGERIVPAGRTANLGPVTFQIFGANDPDAVARKVKRALGELLDQAMSGEVW